MSHLDHAIDDAIESARLEQYAGLSDEQLRRRLLRAEDAHRRLSNILAVVIVAGYVVLFRTELIALLTKLGEISRG